MQLPEVINRGLPTNVPIKITRWGREILSIVVHFKTSPHSFSLIRAKSESSTNKPLTLSARAPPQAITHSASSRRLF